MMGMKSKTKGKTGEREVVALLKRLGFDDAERTQQYNGIGKSDVWCPRSLPDVHIEVKRAEGFDIGTKLLYAACVQAEDDCESDDSWCVFWRPNNKPWRLTATFRLVAFGNETGPWVTATVDEPFMADTLRYLQSNA